MKLYLTLIIVCLFSVGYSQDFGCFSEPNFGDYYRISCSNRRQINNDSLLWIQYEIPKIYNGYYTEMWNKYQKKMEGNILNGKRNGIWRIFLRNEDIFYQVSFNDNKKEGEWKCFKINGNDTLIQIKGFYKNDLKDGRFINYTKDTSVYEISNYKAGKLNGENIIYNFSSNNKKYLSIISEYRDGKLNGTEKEYKLDNREKLQVVQLIQDMGYPFILDRACLNKPELKPSENIDGEFSLQYYS